MGCRLNALEEAQSILADHYTDRQGYRLFRSQQLLRQIADQIGVTTVQLSKNPTAANEIPLAADFTRQSKFDLTWQCADLVEAFAQIQDPEDRLRCLEIVRAAALTP